MGVAPSRSRDALACGIPFADLFEFAPCCYHVLDRDGVYLDINQTGLAWLGCTRDEVVGVARPSDFFDERGKELFAAHHPRFLAGEALNGLELTLYGRNGQRRDVIAFATPVLDEHGRPFATRSVLQDVSTLKARLAAQDLVLDSELVGLARVRDRRFTWLSHGAARMFGYAPGELEGQPTRVLFDRDEDYAAIGAAARGRTPFAQQRMRFRRKDGSLVWTSSRAVPLGDDEHLSVFVDVSAEVRAEQTARRAERLTLQNAQLSDLRRLREQMLRDFSHELRTPLNAILGFSELLLADFQGDEDLRSEFLAHIHAAGQLLLALTDKMLDAGTEGADHWELHPVSIDVLQEVHDTVELFVDAASEKRVHIAVTGDLDGAPFQADPTRFRQALAAYLDNALRVSPARGRIDVSVLQRGPQLRIRVQDQGPGLARDEAASVFSQTAPRQGSDSGLGLSLDMVRAMVEKQGGSVAVHSIVDRGSVFELWLPSAQPPVIESPL